MEIRCGPWRENGSIINFPGPNLTKLFLNEGGILEVIIKNVNLFTEKKEYVKGEIFIENSRFTDHSETGPEID